MLFDVTCDQTINVQARARPFRDRMRAVRVLHKVETLAEFDQSVDQDLRALEMYVVVPRAMHDQQMPLQPVLEVDR
jgi:hypothetical protein